MARASHRRAEKTLRAYALTFREATAWGERFIKVQGKIFVSVGMVDDRLRVGVKLPISAEMALTLPFCEPGGYGLGRAGWITARFADDDDPPIDLLKGWIAQSYRAVAPKKLVTALDGTPTKAKR